MEGAARAARQRHDEAVILAWHTAAFSGAAQAGKLKKLSHYISAEKPKAQSTDEMLAALREFQSRGAGMNIRRVN